MTAADLVGFHADDKVFYEFQAGRIWQVCSVIAKVAIEAQL